MAERGGVPEQPLGDEAIVIRGGTMKPEDLVAACEDYLEDFPSAPSTGLSVFAAVGVTALVLATNVPHRQFRVSTAGRLRSIGCELEQTGKPPHHTLLVPLPITNEKIQRIRDQFDPPQLNPNPRTTS